MRTDNFLDELKKYFESTPKEKILEDWAKSEKFDQVGPSIEDFLVNSQHYYKILLEDPIDLENNFKNTNLSPKFYFGFFIYRHFELIKCKKPLFL